MKTLDDYAFIFGCAYAEACGKDPGDDFAILGQADKAGLAAAITAALEEAAKHFDGYTWSPYKSPAITIREMIVRLAPQSGST